MVQMRLRVGMAVKGSSTAVVGSGMTSMSDALIGCQPRMDEPSNPLPSSKRSSLSSLVGIVKCCQIPSRSRNFRSTASTLLSRTSWRTSLGDCVAIVDPPTLRGTPGDDGPASFGTPHHNVDGAHHRPGAGDPEADVGLVLRVGVTDDVEVEDREQHEHVRDQPEPRDEVVLHDVAVLALREADDRPQAREGV